VFFSNKFDTAVGAMHHTRDGKVTTLSTSLMDPMFFYRKYFHVFKEIDKDFKHLRAPFEGNRLTWGEI
jgi:hypothetical protein